MILCGGFSRRVVYDFRFWDYVEIMDGYHQVTDAFSEGAELNPYVPKESISGPCPNDNYCLWVYLCQEYLSEKS